MRWLFPESEQEQSARANTIDAIDSWWREFSAKASIIAESFKADGPEFDLAEWMEETLQAINPALMWEYGPAGQGEGHRLIITPETEYQLRPLVDTVLERAPTLAGWEFYGHRLPDPYQLAIDTVQGRCGEDVSQWQVLPTISERKIDLALYSPNCPTPDDESSFGTACVAAEAFLGEDCMNKWIGTIQVLPLAHRKSPCPEK